jgi:hypothetical protein
VSVRGNAIASPMAARQQDPPILKGRRGRGARGGRRGPPWFGYFTLRLLSSLKRSLVKT